MKKDSLVEFINPRAGNNPEIVARHGLGPYLLRKELDPCTCSRSPHSEDCASLHTEIQAGGAVYPVKVRDLKSATISPLLVAALSAQ